MKTSRGIHDSRAMGGASSSDLFASAQVGVLEAAQRERGAAHHRQRGEVQQRSGGDGGSGVEAAKRSGHAEDRSGQVRRMNHEKAPICAAFVKMMREVFGDVKVLYVRESDLTLGSKNAS